MLIILVVLSVVTDLIASFLLFGVAKAAKLFDVRKKPQRHDKITKYTRRFLFGFCAILVQQLLLLLEMFTFFHEVSFFVVLSPLVVSIVFYFFDLAWGEGPYILFFYHLR